MTTDRTTFGFPVEIGAQFIHGQRKSSGTLNPVWGIAKAQGWTTAACADSGQTYRSGVPISDALDTSLTDYVDAFTAWVEGHQDSLSITESMASQFQKWVAAQGSRLSSQMSADIRSILFANMEVTSRISLAVAVFDVTTSYFGSTSGCPP